MRSPFLLLCACAAFAAAAAQHGCPDGPQGAALARSAAEGDAASPFLLSAQELEFPCMGGTEACRNPVPWHWKAFCGYRSDMEFTWTNYMICPPQQRVAISEYYASNKSGGFADILRMSPCDLWPLIRGRRLWIVGDSHSYDLFHALACMLAGLWDYDFEGALPTDDEGEALAAMAEHVHHYKPPECLPLLDRTMVCMVRVNHGQVLVRHALPLLSRVADASNDVAVVGFAHWHGSFLPGTPASVEYRHVLKDFRKAAEEGRASGSLPHIVFQEAVPTHYSQQHGQFTGGDPPFECAPLHVELQRDGTLAATDDWSELLLEGGPHNRAAREVFAGTEIVMTQFWNDTVEAWNGHRGLPDGRGQECAHYCFPGVPNIWVYHVYRAIRSAPWLRNLK